MKVRTKVWIEDDRKVIFGGGRVRMLEAIARPLQFCSKSSDKTHKAIGASPLQKNSKTTD